MEEQTTYLDVNIEFYNDLNLDKLAAWLKSVCVYVCSEFFVSMWSLLGKQSAAAIITALFSYVTLACFFHLYYLPGF